MGKFIGSANLKAKKTVNTFVKTDKETLIKTTVTEEVFTTAFINVGNRSILVSVTKAFNLDGSEIDISKVVNFEVKVVSFEGGERAL